MNWDTGPLGHSFGSGIPLAALCCGDGRCYAARNEGPFCRAVFCRADCISNHWRFKVLRGAEKGPLGRYDRDLHAAAARGDDYRERYVRILPPDWEHEHLQYVKIQGAP